MTETIEINEVYIAKVSTDCQGDFYLKVHDGMKIRDIARTVCKDCDIEELHVEGVHLFVVGPDIIEQFEEGIIHNVLTDVVLLYKGGKIIYVDKISRQS